jgi:methylenetetrahydrofolate dehydrogenase (NADP+)/methenyltetrahydrofolate cyclohydrolase
MQLLDGIAARNEIFSSIQKQVACLKRPPGLTVIIIGNNPASEIYVRNKVRAAQRLGFHSQLLQFPFSAKTAEILDTIKKLNDDPSCDGILVQMPLPQHIDANAVILALAPEKDVDGFHPINVGKLCRGMPNTLIPCTPLGIVTLLQHYKINLTGKHVAILGRSTIVGKPLANLLSQNAPLLNATVTLLHSKSTHIASICRECDVVIACMGNPNVITKEFIKPGAVVIDVGINRITDAKEKKGYRIEGDINFEQIAPIASWITPVPGGIGPMTIASLMQNTLQAYYDHEKVE